MAEHHKCPCDFNQLVVRDFYDGHSSEEVPLAEYFSEVVLEQDCSLEPLLFLRSQIDINKVLGH